MIRTRNSLHDIQYQKKLKKKSSQSIRFDLNRIALPINVSMIFTLLLLFLLDVPPQQQRQHLFCSGTTSSSMSASSTPYSRSNSNNDNKENIIYDNDDDSIDNNYDNNIRILDEYGNAKQLQYAMNAANRNGRLIVILTNMPSTWSSSSSSIWIISPIQPKHLSFMKYHRLHPSTPSFISNTNHNNNIGIQQPNTSPSSSVAATISDVFDPTLLSPIIQSISKDSYIVATGINADIQYMIQQLRIYYKYICERYNSIIQLSSKQLITIVQLLLHQFWNYPTIGNNNNNDGDDNDDSTTNGGSWVPMGYRQLMYENQQESNNNVGWGRPMGTCGIILFWNKQYQQFDMIQFDPTGCYVPKLLQQQEQDRNDTPNITITCLGPKHELVHQELIKIQSEINKYRTNHHNDEDILNLEQIILKAIERVTRSNNDNYDDTSTSIKPKSSSSSLSISSEPQQVQQLYQVEELCIPQSFKSTTIHDNSLDEAVQSSTIGTSSVLSSASVATTMMRIIQRH